MSTARLPAMFPVWSDTDHNGERLDEPVEVWYGKPRIVHRQRARKLRRRGVPMMDLRARNGKGPNGYEGRAKFAWFVGTPESVITEGYAL